MIRLICVGKIKENYLVNLIEDYCKRINKYHKLEILELADTNIKNETIKIKEKLNNSFYKVALVINGESYDSKEFAKFIDNNLMTKANIIFIIGGSEGLSTEILDIVDKKISFSKMTFPHGMFRGILLEQIYRAFKIIKNERYHK